MQTLNSLRARMTVGFVLVLAPFLLLTCTVLALVSSRLETAQTQEELRETVVAAKRITARPDWPTSLAEFMGAAHLREHEIGLEVTDAQGHVLWRSSEDLPLPASKASNSWQIAERRAEPGEVFALHPILERRVRRAREAEELLTLSVCVILAVALGAWAMVGRTLRPIHRLAEQAATASASNLNAHLVSPSDDSELVELVGTLNGLLTRQAETAAAKGRFYAAASHELRTPLQALSGHLELALSRPRAASEYLSALEEAHGQTARLISLVRALLLLHQLENPAQQAHVPTDLTALCDTAWAQAQPRLRERGLRGEAALQESVQVNAIPTHAEILLRNLLENAARYAKGEGLVKFTLADTPSGCLLTVYNDADLRDNDDPQTWLEAFTRPDAARAIESGGNGLGLAICRAIAEANGWRLTLSRAGTEGVEAQVFFSRAG